MAKKKKSWEEIQKLANENGSKNQNTQSIMQSTRGTQPNIFSNMQPVQPKQVNLLEQNQRNMSTWDKVKNNMSYVGAYTGNEAVGALENTLQGTLYDTQNYSKNKGNQSILGAAADTARSMSGIAQGGFGINAIIDSTINQFKLLKDTIKSDKTAGQKFIDYLGGTLTNAKSAMPIFNQVMEMSNLGNEATEAITGKDKEDIINAQTAATREISRNYENRRDSLEQDQTVGDATKSVARVFGQVGRMLPTIGTNMALPGAGLAQMGQSVLGSKVNERLDSGDSLSEAVNRGNIAEATEVGTEQLFGGLHALGGGVAKRLPGVSKLGKTIAPITSKVEKVLGKKLMGTLGDVLGESAEEIISDAAEYIIGNIEGEDVEFSLASEGETTIQTIATTLILNALTGGMVGLSTAGSKSVVNKSNLDATTKSNLEEFVKDKQITKQGASALVNGITDIEDKTEINKLLKSGDLQDVVEYVTQAQQTARENIINSSDLSDEDKASLLRVAKTRNIPGEQVQRAIDNKLDEDTRRTLFNNLDVVEDEQGNRTYFEKQATKIENNDNLKSTYKKYYGNNKTALYRNLDNIESIGKEIGARTIFDGNEFKVTKEEAAANPNLKEGAIKTNVEAFFRTRDGKREIVINPYADTKKSFERIFSHELTHGVLGTNTEEANQLKKTVEEFWKKQYGEEKYGDMVKDLKAAYGKNFNDEEITAKTIEQLFTRQEDLNTLANSNPNIFTRIYRNLVSIYAKLTGSEKAYVKKIKLDMELAWSKSKNKDSLQDASNKYSQQTSLDNELELPTQDSQGRELTKEQQDFLINSKAVDNNGHPIKLYHGTNQAGFTKVNNYLFLTTNREIAQDYAGGDKTYDPNNPNSDLTPIQTNGKNSYFKNVEEIRNNINEYTLGDLQAIWDFIDENNGFSDTIYDYDLEGQLNTKIKDIDSNAVQDIVDATLEELNNWNNDDQIPIPSLSNEQGNNSNLYTENRKIYETYANIENPLEMDLQGGKVTTEMINRAKQEGYDGIIAHNTGEGRGNKKGDTYIVFKSNQLIDANNDNVKYSQTTNLDKELTIDNNGRKLSKGQREYFKDTKVRDQDGNLLIVYHGTPSQERFNVFDRSKAGSNVGADFDGIYFTDSKDFGERFAHQQIPTGDSILSGVKLGERGNLYEGYLNITNPLNLNSLTDEQIEELYSYRDESKDPGQTKESFIRKLNIMNNGVNAQGIKFELDMNKVKEAGYDGIIANLGEHEQVNGKWITKDENEYIVFNSNQFKNIDNENPTTDLDIRYSVETEEFDRKLAEKFPSPATTDNNGVMLEDGMKDFMKDSKARDLSNGGLVNVFHTTKRYSKQFNEFNPVGTPYYNFGNQVVNYFTDDEFMSGSYAQQQYTKAQTKRLKSMADVQNLLDEYNKANSNGYEFKIEKVGDTFRLYKDSGEIGKEVENFLSKLSPDEVTELSNNIFHDEEFAGTPMEYSISWTKLNDRLKQKFNSFLENDLGTDRLIEKQAELINNLNSTGEKYFENEEDLFKNLNISLKEIDSSMDKGGTQYSGYVNIQNPYVIDAKGKNWNKIEQLNKEVKSDMDKILKMSEEDKNNVIEFVRSQIDDYHKKRDDFDAFNMEISRNVLSESREVLDMLDGEGKFNLDQLEADAKYGFVSKNRLKTVLEALGIEHGDFDNPETAIDLLKMNPEKVLDFVENRKRTMQTLDGKEEMSLSDIAKYRRYLANRQNNRPYDLELNQYLKDNFNIKSYDVAKALYSDIFSLSNESNENIAKYVFEENSGLATLGRVLRNTTKQVQTNDIVKQVIKYNNELFDDIDKEKSEQYGLVNPYIYKNRTPEDILKVGGYDGVIIRNVVDYGDNVKDPSPHDLYITFGSNQFKAIDNENPTNDPDIRYSKDTQGDWTEYLTKYSKGGTKTYLPQISGKLPTRKITNQDFLDVISSKTNLPQEEIDYAKNMLDQINKTEESLRDFDKQLTTLDSLYAEMNNETQQAPQSIDDLFDEVGGNEVESPLSDRNIETIGKETKTNAYQYENPEVKPYFQEMAQRIGEDLSYVSDKMNRRTVKGGGTKLHTNTKALNDLHNKFGYSYEQIANGLNDIIEDHGSENNAVSKKIEFYIDEALRNGYRNSLGEFVEPNQGYIDTISYSMNIDQNNQPELPKPQVPTAKNTQLPYNPTTDEDLQAIRDNSILATEPEITPERVEEGVEKDTLSYLVEGRTKTKMKNLKDEFMQKFINKGHYVDKLAKATGNKALTYKYDRMLTSFAEAQVCIGDEQVIRKNGENQVVGKSLNDVYKPAVDAKLLPQFEDYLLNRHNIDRFAYEKGVYGTEVSSKDSQKNVAKYEEIYPEFKEWAEDVYAYNRNSIQELVNEGLISQEFYDKLTSMYGSYVPTFRDIQEMHEELVGEGSVGHNVIKKATGSRKPIISPRLAMAEQTIAFKKAIATNEVGKELYKSLGKKSKIFEGLNFDNVAIESLGGNVVEKGKDGNNTFMIFNKGEATQFKISDDLYSAFDKNTIFKKVNNNELASALLTPIEKLTKAQRNLLTTYSVGFAFNNPIKDYQDALYNTKYTAPEFAKNYTVALHEIATNGKMLQEAKRNGLGANTYYDFNKGILPETKSKLKKVGNKVMQVNEVIELAPRLAEYITTREHGGTIDEALYNAAEITTNFKRGGDITKFVNKYGANFVNASVQGLDKQIRNITENNSPKGYARLVFRAVTLGVLPAVINHLLLDDDDDYQDLPDYIKDSYYLFPSKEDGKFYRIPKGRVLAVLGATARRTIELAQGEGDAFDNYWKEVWGNNLAPNNPLTDNLISPIKQALDNNAWYEGEIVSARLQKKPKAEQSDERTDKFSKFVGESIGKLPKATRESIEKIPVLGDLFSIAESPKLLNYVLDQYSGGVGDAVLPHLTPFAEDSMIANKFTTNAILKNKNVEAFYEALENAETMNNSDYATDSDKLAYKYLSGVSKDVGALYSDKREIQNDSTLKDKEKKAKTLEIQKEINNQVEEALKKLEEMKLDNDYASFDGTEYYKNDKGEWKEIDSEDVADGLSNQTYSDYKNKSQKALSEKKKRENKDNAQLTDKERISLVLSSSYTNQEKDLIYDNYIRNDSDKDYAAYKILNGVDGIDDYLNYKSADFTSNKVDDGTVNGKAVKTSDPGSKKSKIINYIENSDFDSLTKLYLYGTNYKLSKTERKEFDNMLNQKNLTPEQKKQIYLTLNGVVEMKDGSIQWK
jgi:hypothetical protein